MSWNESGKFSRSFLASRFSMTQAAENKNDKPKVIVVERETSSLFRMRSSRCKNFHAKTAKNNFGVSLQDISFKEILDELRFLHEWLVSKKRFRSWIMHAKLWKFHRRKTSAQKISQTKYFWIDFAHSWNLLWIRFCLRNSIQRWNDEKCRVWQVLKVSMRVKYFFGLTVWEST